MPTRPRSAFFVLALLAFAACKSDEAAGPLEGFGKQMARATCDKVYECCTAVEAAVHMDYTGGHAACLTKSEATLGFWASVIEAEQQRGRLSFDVAQARRCLAAYTAASCETHKANTLLDGCETFLTARTMPGAACASNESCIDGTCVGAGASDGTCVANIAIGGTCGEGTPGACAKGLYCSAGRCVAKQANGATCNANLECASAGCNGKDADAGTPGTCGRKGGEATRCPVTTGCAFAVGSAPSAGLALFAFGLAVALLLRRRR